MIGAGGGANSVDWTKTVGLRDSASSSAEQAQTPVAIATTALAPNATFLTLMN
ncbi:hypothetical protein RW1_035_00450 [Rhodococcus wratislaviensis NBRC 100605]|uniref:Uncharacterized protein n=1 Tax=Rhodococcus wratislaviensis NBRC 100605 TaxID=1219028 RepID=X0Q6C6_RHOWR|nr:hypothetical protein RW1_035_00450 [Rhodococcus wratislaviensis NBRC 100605]